MPCTQKKRAEDVSKYDDEVSASMSGKNEEKISRKKMIVSTNKSKKSYMFFITIFENVRRLKEWQMGELSE